MSPIVDKLKSMLRRGGVNKHWGEPQHKQYLSYHWSHPLAILSFILSLRTSSNWSRRWTGYALRSLQFCARALPSWKESAAVRIVFAAFWDFLMRSMLDTIETGSVLSLLFTLYRFQIYRHSPVLEVPYALFVGAHAYYFWYSIHPWIGTLWSPVQFHI